MESNLNPNPAVKPPLDRRPLNSRSWSYSIKAASLLAARGATPNSISIAGMVCGIVAGITFALTAIAYQYWGSASVRALWIASAMFMQFRLLSNLFDGMVAVELNKASPVGELYNEVPDRISDAAILIGAGLALGGNMQLGYIAALAAVFGAYIRATGKGILGTSDYRGPMAKQQRMALLTAWCLIAAFLPSTWWTASIPAIPGGPLAGVLLVVIVGTLYTAIRRLTTIAHTLKTKIGNPIE